MPEARFTKLPLIGMLLGALGVSVAFGEEVVHFKNKFELTVDSHTQRGESVEVQVGSGSLEFPTADISSIEPLAKPTPELKEKKRSEQPTPGEALLEAALSQGVDQAFVRSVAQIESGLIQNRTSGKGAIGLMQLMPTTAKELGVDPTRLDENVRGGVQYLRSLLIRYKGNSVLALAAYNAGPGAVEKFKGVPPYSETRRYVLSVLAEYSRQLQIGKAAPGRDSVAVRKLSKPSATD